MPGEASWDKIEIDYRSVFLCALWFNYCLASLGVLGGSIVVLPFLAPWRLGG